MNIKKYQFIDMTFTVGLPQLFRLTAVKPYVRLLRLDYWTKNLSALPGVIFAIIHHGLPSHIVILLATGTVAMCLTSSANYVLNEWLDAKSDKYHPTKNTRVLVKGAFSPVAIFFTYVFLMGISLVLASLVSSSFLLTTITFLLMGVIYNVPPFRAKEIPYIDVLTESFNNPIRFLLGSFMIMPDDLPTTSLLLSYWASGAFLMAMKRYSELHFFSDRKIAALYRKSFQSYTQHSLAAFAVCCAIIASVFFVTYAIKNYPWLLFLCPFVFCGFVWYFMIGLRGGAVLQFPKTICCP